MGKKRRTNLPELIPSPVVAYVSLGANLGDPQAQLRAALQALAAMPQTRLVRQSALYRSKPVAATGPDYVNAVAQLQTSLNALALLHQLQQLENAAGRLRPYANAPRSLDLDLLLYGEAQIHCATLSVPHPRMRERAFVLLPLAELAPALVSAQQLRAVRDQEIERIVGT